MYAFKTANKNIIVRADGNGAWNVSDAFLKLISYPLVDAWVNHQLANLLVTQQLMRV